MKKAIALILIAAMTAAFGACGVKVEYGPKLESNTARVYTAGDRLSSFVIDGVKIEGTVPGTASMDNAADGRTSLANVDNSVVYFVSEQGVDPLGTAVFSEEISFDGRTACYLEGNKLMRYTLDTRSAEPILEGVFSVAQLAISPHGQTVAMTGVLEDEGVTTAVFIIGKDGAKRVFEGEERSVIAITDDGSVYYTLDRKDKTLCVFSDGEKHTISSDIGGASVFNFTSDLSELCYYTAGGVNRLFKLADKSDTELCTGFGYTAKTDRYSISWGEAPVYINDVTSFINGLFLCRSGQEGGYTWDLGVLSAKGIKWIVKEAEDYSVIEEKNCVVWISGGKLQRTGFGGKTKLLAENAVDMAVAETGDIYYRSDAKSLFVIKNFKKPVKLDSGVSSIAGCGKYCFYIKDKPIGGGAETAGRLFRTEGAEGTDMQVNAALFGKRSGHLLIYADPEKTEGELLYRLLFTHDGEAFTAEFAGVRI